MRRLCLAAATLTLLLPAVGAGEGMVDPRIDGLFDPFSYLVKPSTVLGGTGADGITQVTWDGSFYTGEIELLIVAGDPPHAIAPRVKELGGGYVPLVRYAWLEEGLRIAVTAFAGTVEEVGPVNFIRLRAQRTEDGNADAAVGFALRHSGIDHRAEALEVAPFDPAAKHELARGLALVGDRAVCALPAERPSRRYAVADAPYKKPFTGESAGVRAHTATLINVWDVGARGEVAVDLKMPWRPIPRQSKKAIEALKHADVDEQAELVVDGWQAELARGMAVELAELKPTATYYASLAYSLMSLEAPDDGSPTLRHRLENRALTPVEAATVIEALDSSGRHTLARSALSRWIKDQGEDGRLTADGDIAGHAALLRCAGSHAWLTGDREWAEAVYPTVRQAENWLGSRLLLPDTPADQRADALLGVNAAAELAALLGRDDDLPTYQLHWEKSAFAYEERLGSGPMGVELLPGVLSSLRGLPDALPAPMSDPWEETYTELCRRLHAESAEGLVTEAGALSPLATAHLGRLHAARGEQQAAIRLLYSLLAHTGSCHEGFARGVTPWLDRDSGEALTPDPLFSAAYMTLFRDLLIREQGPELHLFSAVSPEWLQTGQTLGVEAVTHFGLVSAALHVEETGGRLALVAPWHAEPTRVVLHLPYFVTVKDVRADYPGLTRREGPAPLTYTSADSGESGDPGRNVALEFSPNTMEVSIDWERDAAEELNYERTVEALKARYVEAFYRYTDGGGEPRSIEPLPLK